MAFLHIGSIHDIYEAIGSIVIGWVLNDICDWFKHTFWVGFKAGLAEQARLGRQLTPTEFAAVKARVNAQLMAEFNKKLMRVADMADDAEVVQP